MKRLHGIFQALGILGLSGLVTTLAVGASIGFSFAYGQFVAPRLFTVVRTVDGFSPKMITIPVGATVTFTSSEVKPFWPASNFHPFHDLYPGFDPKRPVEATESWSFRFIEPGLYRYHDHLDPKFGATVRVKSLQLFASLYDSCEGSLQTDIRVKLRCWQQKVERVLRKKGLAPALDEFATLFEQEAAFRPYCHDVGHLLGEAGYREFDRRGTVVMSAKTTYCGYGFYHGFIEAMLFSGGNLHKARTYCEAIQQKLQTDISSPIAINACYHGFGHGTFDTLPSSFWGDEERMTQKAIARCDEFTQGKDEEPQKQCATGVFNALANSYGLHYDLTINEKAPMHVCDRQTRASYKRACYVELALAYMRVRRMDSKQALNFVLGIDDPVGASGAILGFIDNEIRDRIDTIDEKEIADICDRFESRPLRGACLEAAVVGFFNRSAPGQEYQHAFRFCRLGQLSASEQEHCLRFAIRQLETVYSKQQAKQICIGLNLPDRSFCDTVQQ